MAPNKKLFSGRLFNYFCMYFDVNGLIFLIHSFPFCETKASFDQPSWNNLIKVFLLVFFSFFLLSLSISYNFFHMSQMLKLKNEYQKASKNKNLEGLAPGYQIMIIHLSDLWQFSFCWVATSHWWMCKWDVAISLL